MFNAHFARGDSRDSIDSLQCALLESGLGEASSVSNGLLAFMSTGIWSRLQAPPITCWLGQ